MSARVVVVGGGISGLTVAHRLAREGESSVSVTLLEAECRLGGQVRTECSDGFVFEGGADTLLTQKPWGVALCGRLGLSDDLEDIGARHAGTQILFRGRLRKVPRGFLMMAPTRVGPLLASSLFSWRGKLRMLAEPFVAPRPAGREDESLSTFVTRRFGREVLERVAEPMIAGLYTADADRLSLRMTMPRFLDLEAREGSVTRPLRRTPPAKGTRAFGHGTGGGFVALRGGLGRIVEALAARLPEGTVRTGARVARVRRGLSRARWLVELSQGDAIAADAVVFACPGYEAARMLAAEDEPLGALLGEQGYASCATVHLVYRSHDVGAPLTSFGFFVPRTEGLPILACSYVSEKFSGRAPEGTVVLRVFLGGAARAEVLDSDDAAIVRLAHDAVRGVLRLASEPKLTMVHRHPRAMPQYDVGAQDRIGRLLDRAKTHAGIYFAGGTVGAVGIPDCVRVAEETAARVASDLGHFEIRGQSPSSEKRGHSPFSYRTSNYKVL